MYNNSFLFPSRGVHAGSVVYLFSVALFVMFGVTILKVSYVDLGSHEFHSLCNSSGRCTHVFYTSVSLPWVLSQGSEVRIRYSEVRYRVPLVSQSMILVV